MQGMPIPVRPPPMAPKRSWAAGYSRVIILGPAHRVYMENRICIPSEADGMSTPLGTLAFDREALEKLRSLPFIATGDKILAQEHSVQIQLPFLQYALGNDFKAWCPCGLSGQHWMTHMRQKSRTP